MSDPQFSHLLKATLHRVEPEQRFWPARVRWRLRGAWMWPTFVVVTLLDGLLLHLLPPVRTGIDLIPAVLLATFGNLVLVAAEPDAPPKAQLEVLSDRIGTGLLVASVFGVLAAGLAARPTVIAETDAKEEAARAIHAHIQASGDPELIRNEETAHAARLADGYFRICIARDDRESFSCFFVDTNRDPTRVLQDPSQEPNEIDP
jgi:hypothetical protein